MFQSVIARKNAGHGENPMVATNNPRTRTDSASPPASAIGPDLCRDAAVPSTMGKSGSTQGEKMDTSPARKVSV